MVGSNLGRGTVILAEVFRGFLIPAKQMSEQYLLVPRLNPSKSFPIHHLFSY
jgi:hypothetical protein